jgi:ribosome-binding protein aMBF1 (putative translation factor)
MEEFLPIIIGIIWLVYTIYSKGKKKEAKRHHPGRSEQAKAPSILEQLFTDSEVLKPQSYETYDEPVESQLVDEYDEVVNEPEQESGPLLRTELSDFMQEGQPAITASGNYMMEEKTDMENQIEKLDFDLRKAIIFSEILNAPYIGYK